MAPLLCGNATKPNYICSFYSPIKSFEEATWTEEHVITDSRAYGTSSGWANASIIHNMICSQKNSYVLFRRNIFLD